MFESTWVAVEWKWLDTCMLSHSGVDSELWVRQRVSTDRRAASKTTVGANVWTVSLPSPYGCGPDEDVGLGRAVWVAY